MQYVDIFRNQAKTFWLIVLFFVVGASAWQGIQPKTYDAALLLNIGRSTAPETAGYAYDDFYRLQADERFADTVVRWLASPRVVEDIYAESGIDADAASLRSLRSALSGKRLSSQVIEVSYGARNERQAFGLSRAIISVLNRYTAELNTDGRRLGWFSIIGSDPVIRDGRTSLPVALTVGVALGVFFGFWMVLVRHYLTGREKRR